MADYIYVGGKIVTHVREWGVSGLPGLNMSSAPLYGSIDVTTRVTTTGHVIISCSGSLRASHIYGTGFPMKLFASKDYFEITVNANGSLPTPSNSVEYAAWTAWHSGGGNDFSTSVPTNDVDVGKITDFHWDGLNGYLYLGGSAYDYAVTDDVTTHAVRISIQGLKKFLDYFPGEVYSGHSWGSNTSCNREGGYVKVLKGGVWTNIKNRDSDFDKSHTFIYDGSSSHGGWGLIAPKRGTE